MNAIIALELDRPADSISAHGDDVKWAGETLPDLARQISPQSLSPAKPEALVA